MHRWAILAGVVMGFLGAALFFAVPRLRERTDFINAEKDMKEFSIAYFEYQKEHGRPPASADELKAKLETGSATTRAWLGAGKLDVQWGAPLDPKLAGADKRVLACLKESFNGKMICLMQDGSLRQLLPAELEAAEKAKATTKE